MDTANALAVSINGPVTVSNATPSTTKTTGALTVSGGVGISGALYSDSVSTTYISGYGYLTERSYNFNPTSNTSKYFLCGTVEENVEIEIRDNGFNHGQHTKIIVQRAWDTAPRLNVFGSYTGIYKFYYTSKNERYYLWFNESYGSSGNNCNYYIKIRSSSSSIITTEPAAGELFATQLIDVTAATEITGANYNLYVAGLGNVGIATANPSQKLHVIGNILSSGTIECGVQMYGTVSDSPGAPSFSFSGDTDTGMFRAGGNVLCFATGGTEKVRIDGSGNVGIGATPTRAQLEVIGSNGSTTLTYYALTGTGVSGPLTQTNPYGIYTNSRIAASQFNATSDVRIKKNIRDIVDSSALDTFRLLEPKIYNYIDEVQRGTSNVYGFIAQDVSNIMPYAVTLSTSEIPNILEVANVSQSNVLTFINFNTSNLESNTVIQIIDINGNKHDITLVELIDDHTIRVAEDVSKWSKSVDNDITETITVDEYEALADKTGYVAVEDTDTYTKTTSVRISEQIFVYGQNINDFHHLNKDSIWTVATAALQEVDRQQQADKVRIAQLESQLAAVLARLDALENI